MTIALTIPLYSFEITFHQAFHQGKTHPANRIQAVPCILGKLVLRTRDAIFQSILNLWDVFSFLPPLVFILVAHDLVRLYFLGETVATIFAYNFYQLSRLVQDMFEQAAKGL